MGKDWKDRDLSPEQWADKLVKDGFIAQRERIAGLEAQLEKQQGALLEIRGIIQDMRSDHATTDYAIPNYVVKIELIALAAAGRGKEGS